jgi:hypothetical protein
MWIECTKSQEKWQNARFRRRAVTGWMQIRCGVLQNYGNVDETHIWLTCKLCYWYLHPTFAENVQNMYAFCLCYWYVALKVHLNEVPGENVTGTWHHPYIAFTTNIFVTPTYIIHPAYALLKLPFPHFWQNMYFVAFCLILSSGIRSLVIYSEF